MKFDRNTLIEMIANQMTDNADLDDLMDYYYNGTVEFLDDLSDEELLEQADWVGVTNSEDEFE
jgi:hypothetical protein